MAFCSKGFAKAKKILQLLTPALEAIIDTVLAFTGKLLAFTNTPGIAELLAIIPGEAAIHAALVTGINLLTAADVVLKETDPAKKLKLFMADLETYDQKHRHALMIKLASILTAILDGQKQKENAYDSLVQLKASIT
jgi:hypothetical protein